ncbi:Malonyl CoA-acyl carrier protein transacylase [Candida viswanathii]|uniref:[acyl-carrier-protein] S-malonyltransferase n=1 Tax=Candida viswanathii TaxID=5486 RepID=A0A367Y9S3_9ASCO|nr:Malonyl CoA-acyl carrier protein transacylase [Candida viswanathii]
MNPMKPLSNIKYAITCPGQGFYRNGLLEPVKHHRHLYQRYLEELDDTLQQDFSSRLFASEREQDAREWLGKTSNAQPAMLASAYILLKLVETQTHGVGFVLGASYLLGHSLGEYTALVLSGVVDFATGLKVVRKRGELMEELCQGGRGGVEYGMVALLIKPKFVDDVVLLAREWNVLGNINSTFQIVVSGEVEKLHKFIDKLKEVNRLAVMKAVTLPVSIPFHSDILQPIVPELALLLEGQLKPQLIPIISNLNGEVSGDAETTVKNLLEANYQPVQWFKSMTFLEKSPVETVFNLGPGEAIHGINRKYKINSVSLDDIDNVQLDK